MIEKDARLKFAHRSTVLVGYVQFTSVFSIPLRNQVVDLNTPVKAGLRLLPLVASTAVGSMVGGAASAKKNLTYYTMIIGTALVVLGTGLMSSLPTNGNQTNSQYGYEVLLGLGMGMSISTATFMNSLEVEFIDHGKRNLSSQTSFTNFFQLLHKGRSPNLEFLAEQ